MTLSSMSVKYAAIVVACLSYAGTIVGVTYLQPQLPSWAWALWWALFLLWPFWTVYLWRHSKGMKVYLRVLAVIVPVVICWRILLPVLKMTGFARW
jgi:hypothetical protein